MSKNGPIDFEVAQLRHLYENMLAGNIGTAPGGLQRLADGLLAPVIQRLERYNDAKGAR